MTTDENAPTYIPTSSRVTLREALATVIRLHGYNPDNRHARVRFDDGGTEECKQSDLTLVCCDCDGPNPPAPGTPCAACAMGQP